MRVSFARCAICGALAVCPALAACTADVHDNTLNASVPGGLTFTTSADVNNVKPGESIPCHAESSGNAGGGSTASGSDAGASPVTDGSAAADAAQPPPAQTQTTTNVYQIFIDTLSDTPLMVSTQVDFNVTIPANISAGAHKLICRLAHSDGTPTNVITSIDIKVTSG
jgi:hypothetical protein